MKAEIKPRFNFEGRTKLETVIPLSTPYLVFLDPSDKCNQSCPMCPSGNKKLLKSVGRNPQLMGFALYKKIIDTLCDMPEPIKTLRLYKDGEPLLNPRFPDMVRYAKETGRFGQIDTTTNGKLLDKYMAWKLVEAGLDKIFISVPANYDEEYLLDISEFFLGTYYTEGEHGGKLKVYVKIIGDFLSDAQKKKFLSDFGNISDYKFIENLAPCWPGYDVGKIGNMGIYGQPIKEVQVCPYIFYSLAINSDGTVSLCFLDYPHKMILGDLKTESFKDIWEGEKLRNFRIKMLVNRQQIPFCSECKQLSYGAADCLDDFADELLKKFPLTNLPIGDTL